MSGPSIPEMAHRERELLEARNRELEAARERRRRLATARHALLTLLADEGEDAVAVVVEDRTVDVPAFTRNTWVDVPGDFSRALSIVAQLTIDDLEIREPVAQIPPGLRWRLNDSIDGTQWSSLEDTNGLFHGRITRPRDRPSWIKGDTRRFVVPPAPKLSLALQPVWAGPTSSDQSADDKVRVVGCRLRLVVRSLGGLGGAS